MLDRTCGAMEFGCRSLQKIDISNCYSTDILTVLNHLDAASGSDCLRHCRTWLNIYFDTAVMIEHIRHHIEICFE